MTSRRSKSLAQLERDAALRRVSRVRRWSLAGAAGLTAGVAAFVSAVAPGKSLSAKRRATAQLTPPTRTRAPANDGRAKMPPLASASDLGLQGPSESPQASAKPDPTQTPQDQSQAPPDQSQVAPTPAPAPAPPAPVVSGGS
jgi:hypothetical protein